MKRNTVLIIITIALLLFVKCQSNEISESSDVNQDKIYQQYKVYYDESNNNIDVEATFRFDTWKGNTLNLTTPSSVSVNDNVLQVHTKIFGGRDYTRSIQLKAKDYNTANIIFTDINNKVFKNTIKFYPIGKIEVPKTTSRTENFSISWQNQLINKDDVLNIHFSENKAQDIDTTTNRIPERIEFTKTATKGQNSITIDIAQFKGLENDTVFVKIDKDKELKLQEQTKAKGVIYLSHPVYDGMIIFK